MNCRPGDLAIVISDAGQPEWTRALGGMVRCLRMLAPYEHPFGVVFWRYEALSANVPAGDTWAVMDSCLRPIRGAPQAEQRDERAPLDETCEI